MGTDIKCKMTALVIAATVCLVPSATLAGSYGASAVKDDSVGRQASTGQEIWCGKLDRNIPASLAAEMDCSGTARSAVATNRVRNFLGLPLPTNRRIPRDDDNPAPRVTRTTTTPPTEEPPTTPTASRTNKWDRLGELGVTRENFREQSPEFREAVREYRQQNGGSKGDWSGFTGN